jgi:hypothetical protein
MVESPVECRLARRIASSLHHGSQSLSEVRHIVIAGTGNVDAAIRRHIDVMLLAGGQYLSAA